MKNIIKHAFCSVIAFGLFFTALSPTVNHINFANAEGLFDTEYDYSSTLEYPYTQTFTLSAYYSPLPCQDRYATGSYDGDIRLNGSGVNSADGTPVYPGMIAAPKTYEFGTKMYIPGIGIVAVHDRGGAIVTAGNRGQSYDRLDVWMGYGDNGLDRALNFGKRTLEVTVYGITDSVIEDVNLYGYTADEAIPNSCDENPEPLFAEAEVGDVADADDTSVEVIDDLVAVASNTTVEIDNNYFGLGLSVGDTGDEVTKLQEELKSMNFYMVEPSGVYDELTEHAVFKYQQSRGIVASADDDGAGNFGPKTRSSMNGVVAMRSDAKAMIAEATSNASSIIAMGL